MKHIIRTFLLLLAFPLVSLNAQKKWTLQECYTYALEHNIQLKREALKTEVAKNNLRQSKFELLPSVGAGVTHSFIFNALTQNYTWANKNLQEGSAGVQADLNLFNGFRTLNNIEYNKLNLEASLADLEKAKNDLALNIAATYLQVLYNKELLHVAKV